MESRISFDTLKLFIYLKVLILKYGPHVLCSILLSLKMTVFKPVNLLYHSNRRGTLRARLTISKNCCFHHDNFSTHVDHPCYQVPTYSSINC